MIDSQGNRLYLSRANFLTGSTTGVKINFDPLMIHSVGVLRAIAFHFTNTGGDSIGIKLQDGAGNDITNALTLSGSSANVTYYKVLNDTDFASASKKYVYKGDVIRVNVTTAGAGNFYIGLVID